MLIRNAWLLCLSLLASLPIYSIEPLQDPQELIQHEIARLDNLICATQQSLEGQQNLRSTILEHQKIYNFYLQRPEDNERLLSLVKSAYRTLEAIKKNHLIYTFDADFIDELSVLSQVAAKRGIPKP